MVAVAASYFYRAVGSIVAWHRTGRKLTILIYHQVLECPDPCRPDEIDRETFDWQMEVLAANFIVLPLGEAIDQLQRGILPARAACITFDDGYADNASIALPVLQRHGLCATFFVATGFLNGGRMWNDSVIEALRAADKGILDLDQHELGHYEITDLDSRRTAIDHLINKLKYLPVGRRAQLVEKIIEAVGKDLPDDLMMTTNDVRRLSASGMEIGAHTVNHPILSAIDEDEAIQEISTSRRNLEEIIGRPVDLFAYPNGKPDQDYGRRDSRIVRELGFKAAVSTAWGAATRGADPHQLPRFTPWDRTPHRFTLRLLQNYLRDSALARQ